MALTGILVLFHCYLEKEDNFSAILCVVICIKLTGMPQGMTLSNAGLQTIHIWQMESGMRAPEEILYFKDMLSSVNALPSPVNSLTKQEKKKHNYQ